MDHGQDLFGHRLDWRDGQILMIVLTLISFSSLSEYFFIFLLSCYCLCSTLSVLTWLLDLLMVIVWDMDSGGQFWRVCLKLRGSFWRRGIYSLLLVLGLRRAVNCLNCPLLQLVVASWHSLGWVLDLVLKVHCLRVIFLLRGDLKILQLLSLSFGHSSFVELLGLSVSMSLSYLGPNRGSHELCFTEIEIGMNCLRHGELINWRISALQHRGWLIWLRANRGIVDRRPFLKISAPLGLVNDWNLIIIITFSYRCGVRDLSRGQVDQLVFFQIGCWHFFFRSLAVFLRLFPWRFLHHGIFRLVSAVNCIKWVLVKVHLSIIETSWRVVRVRWLVLLCSCQIPLTLFVYARIALLLLPPQLPLLASARRYRFLILLTWSFHSIVDVANFHFLCHLQLLQIVGSLSWFDWRWEAHIRGIVVIVASWSAILLWNWLPFITVVSSLPQLAYLWKLVVFRTLPIW